MPSPRPLVHASNVLSISLLTSAQVIGTVMPRRPTRKFHSFRGDRPMCLTQRCTRTSSGVRGMPEMSNPNGDVQAFFDQVHHAIHEQHFHVDVLMASDEFAHNRRNIASAE